MTWGALSGKENSTTSWCGDGEVRACDLIVRPSSPSEPHSTARYKNKQTKKPTEIWGIDVGELIDASQSTIKALNQPPLANFSGTGTGVTGGCHSTLHAQALLQHPPPFQLDRKV